MEHCANDSAGISKPVTEQANAPAVGHAAARLPVINGSIPKNVGFCVADQNSGLMGKLREAFFNYLRNRVL